MHSACSVLLLIVSFHFLSESVDPIWINILWSAAGTVLESGTKLSILPARGTLHLRSVKILIIGKIRLPSTVRSETVRSWSIYWFSLVPSEACILNTLDHLSVANILRNIHDQIYL